MAINRIDMEKQREAERDGQIKRVEMETQRDVDRLRE